MTWAGTPLHGNIHAIAATLHYLPINFTNNQSNDRPCIMPTTYIYKKPVLPQRWPRNAPYKWVPWIFSGLPEYAHEYYSQHFSWAFVPIDPMNVPTKFEVRSFTRSSDNRRQPTKLAVPGYARAPFSQKFWMGFYSDWPCKCTRQIWNP